MSNCNQNFFKVILCFLILIQTIFGILFIGVKFGFTFAISACNQLGVYRNKCWEGEQNMRKAQHFLCPPLRASREGGQNLNCKFKTFGFLDTLKVHVQLPFKDYLISPWDKTRRKKQQINLFNTLQFQFQIWKVMIALRGMGHCPPLYCVYALACNATVITGKQWNRKTTL